MEYLGAAHGLCSILQAILSVPGYFDANPSDQSDVKMSIDYLLSLQSQEGWNINNFSWAVVAFMAILIGNFPAATDEIGLQGEPKLVHWCHGAGGTVVIIILNYINMEWTY